MLVGTHSGGRHQPQTVATGGDIRVSSCDRPAPGGCQARHTGGQCPCCVLWIPAMTSLTQAEVLIALVVAAHAGVLAVRLAASLYRA
ncbi:MAG: photosystem I reaction center subunit XII [Synechococcaceae bacterium WBB_10_009]|nr:photosystem I reaction center subunit XII [Synechococcaceae bacterium WBB_10_009]